MDYFKSIAELIELPGVSYEEILGAVTEAEEGMGDFTFPCFRFAKALRKPPKAIAEEVLAGLPTLPLHFERAEAVNGYLNFHLNRTEFLRALAVMPVGKAKAAKGKTVVLDYSSVNIAKPFHMGHLSTTAIGGSLYRIFKHEGYAAVGINHLGDFGTQFGKNIMAYKLWGNEEEINAAKIKGLNDLYVRFHREEEKDPSLSDAARAWSKKIEDGDPEAVRLFNWFKELTMADVDAIYKRLGIEFDYVLGESFYLPFVPDVVAELDGKGLLTESEGAKIVDLAEYNMPPCLILRADGASLYATRDIAAAKYRRENYGFDKCLYVVAYQQNLHFAQFFKVLELMGYEWAKDLVHVSYGMVSLEEGAMSTRAGNVVYLADVLDAAVSKAKEIIGEKGAGAGNLDEIAEDVGVGAVMYTAVCNARIKDIVFSLPKVLNFDGETGPYIQYTHARCCSVLEKAGGVNAAPDFSGAATAEAFRLAKELAAFDSAVTQAAELCEPCFVSKKLIRIAQAFNRFYIADKILTDDEGLKAARLVLTRLTRDVLAKGLELILLKAPQKM